MSTQSLPTKSLPFSQEQLEDIAAKVPTPFYLYDEVGIRRTARELHDAFAWCPGFREFFAVKATPNPHIVRVLQQEGCGGDCSSLAELILCERLGILGEQIMFTSNNTLWKEYQKAIELGAVLNVDDISHLDYIDEHVGLPELISVRYNPGPLREGNAIIGKPEEAKYGFTREQIFDGFTQMKQRGVKRFGLHTMVASNELASEFFVETARMLFDLALELDQKIGIRVEFMNLGGGIGIPYRPDQVAIDLKALGASIAEAYGECQIAERLGSPAVFMENGRVMTGPHGYLVTRAVHRKDIYKSYVGVDACMANLMRPGMYGAYHHISVVGKDGADGTEVCDVVGSLCENNDKFAIDREIPKVERGDLLVVHDSGAHGHAMGFQYNGKLRCAEFLVADDGSVNQIRRPETLDDYFATVDWPNNG